MSQITIELTPLELSVLLDAAAERAEDIESYAMTPAEKAAYWRVLTKLRAAA